MWGVGAPTCWQVGGGGQGSQQGSDSQELRALRRGPCVMRCPVWAGCPHLGPSPQTRPRRPCRPCQPWGLGLSRNTAVPPAAMGTGQAGQLSTCRWTPAAQSRPVCGPPNVCPHQQPPYIQPGDRQPGGECWACDLDVHTLPGTEGPGHAATTRDLQQGPSTEAGPSPGGRPGRVGAAVPMASASPCPEGGPEAWGRPGSREVMDMPEAPCLQGCQAPPPVPWACLAHRRSC